MKKNPLVQIPVGHACLSLTCLFQMNMEAERLRAENTENLRDITRIQGQFMKATEQLSEAEAKIKELEKERTKLDKESLDWYRKYAALRDKYEPKHNAVKPDAEAEKT